MNHPYYFGVMWTWPSSPLRLYLFGRLRKTICAPLIEFPLSLEVKRDKKEVMDSSPQSHFHITK